MLMTSNNGALVQFYKDGFFGYGEKGDFRYFSIAHIIPLLLLGLGIFLFFRFREKLRNWKHEENFRFAFAFLMLFFEMSYFWRLVYVGSSEPGVVKDLLDKLPLQVCQWTCIFASFMIMKKSHNLFNVCFYVCLTMGIFPLITPAVITTTGPTYYRYYQYWGEHILPVLSVFYMMFVHGFKPTKKKMLLGIAFMSVLMVAALICNANIPDANYLYLTTEGTANQGGSPMDLITGIHIVPRVILLAAVCIGLFFAAYYIHYAITKKFGKKSESKPSNEEAEAVKQ